MSNESGAQLPELRDLAHHNTGDGSVATEALVEEAARMTLAPASPAAANGPPDDLRW
jgi:hypothetical protein